MPAADLYKRADQRTAVRREPIGAKGQEEKAVPVEGAPLRPQPPQGEDEVLPDRELNLDGLVPPPLVKLHQ